jgi:hypothetical protein
MWLIKKSIPAMAQAVRVPIAVRERPGLPEHMEVVINDAI